MLIFSRMLVMVGLLVCTAAIAGDEFTTYDRANGVTYKVVTYNYWGLGNQRALITVKDAADAVYVRIPWRRHDLNPESKDIRVYEAASKDAASNRVLNIVRVKITREAGEIVFQPTAGKGDYYVYYLPYLPSGSPFVQTKYDEVKETADPAWIKTNKLAESDLQNGSWKSLPVAKTIEIHARPDWGVDPSSSQQPQEIQARQNLHRFDPMELVATSEEVNALAKRFSKLQYMVFSEDREHQIRLLDAIPLRWTENGPKDEFVGKVQPGEFYPLQIGVYASQKALTSLELKTCDLVTSNGAKIPKSDITCLNLAGVNAAGEPVRKIVDVAKGHVQPLWVCIDIPKTAKGIYHGVLTVRPAGLPPTKINVSVDVSGDVLLDHGDSNLRKLTRLRWLDSKLGINDEVIPPYTPLKMHGNRINLLDRSIAFGTDGLPSSIKSNGIEILTAPIELRVAADGQLIHWKPASKLTALKLTAAKVQYVSTSASKNIDMKTSSITEFDGCVRFEVTLTAKTKTSIKDIGLRVPIQREVAEYMLGFSRRGGFRPREWSWSWDIDRADNMIWLGGGDAGMQLQLSHPQEHQFVTNFRDIGLPKTWDNDGRGGCVLYEDAGSVVVQAYTGDRVLIPGQPLTLKFQLLITPFKPISPKHWDRRFAGDDGNIGLCFQGAAVNPYINYPFLTPEATKAFHDAGRKKNETELIYYGLGAGISFYAAELWPLRSLGNEIFAAESMIYYEDKAEIKKGGGGLPWLQEHLVTGYTPTWQQPLPGGEIDYGLAVNGFSRLNNFYVEGMDWLMKNLGVNGLYLDGIGYDRLTMQRVSRVMYKNNPDGFSMMHGGNGFDWANQRVSTMNLHMAHLPYIDHLWNGEGYDYNSSPDYWFTEIVGIPFGLAGQMLNYETGGNQWRGMVYGMTGVSNKSQTGIRKLWMIFGIKDAKWLGYWSKRCPVKTNGKDILATAYVKNGKTLISIASWAKETKSVSLTFDWNAIGIDKTKAKLTAPAIEAFQDAREFNIDNAIPVEPGKGWLIVVK